jgi:hypothetical protein
MGDDESIVVVPRDSADVARLELATELEQLLQQGVTPIVETITGLFASGKWGGAVVGGRIVQGALKYKLFEQVAKEIRDLRAKGKIADDFAEKKYAFNSWVELFTIIDGEGPDEDRLEALKAMFYSVNKINATDGEKILAYQLFQIAKKLSSGQLLLLRSAYQRMGSPAVEDADKWLALMSQRLGHNISELIEQDERVLMEHRLLTGRRSRASVQSNFSTAPIDQRGVNDASGRLTGLAVRFCENIENYRIDLAECRK